MQRKLKRPEVDLNLRETKKIVQSVDTVKSVIEYIWLNLIISPSILWFCFGWRSVSNNVQQLHQFIFKPVAEDLRSNFYS